MRTFDDVWACDAWMGSYWDTDSQGWICTLIIVMFLFGQWWTSDSHSPRPFLLLPKLQVLPQPTSCLLILMPGPHIEMKLMQTFSDVGGCDCWIGSYWEGNQQWWVGWHSPNNLHGWAWPSDEWLLLGHERWYCPRRGEPKVLEAMYATPNPIDPSATLATARWPLAQCLEPLWPLGKYIELLLVEDGNCS